MTTFETYFGFMLLFVTIAASIWAVAYVAHLLWHGHKGRI
jgi:hypothetical protein